MTQFQDKMIAGMHAYGVYFLYAGVCAMGVAFVLIILPETSGKSPEDMKAHFSGKHHTKSKPHTTHAEEGNENKGYDE